MSIDFEYFLKGIDKPVILGYFIKKAVKETSMQSLPASESLRLRQLSRSAFKENHSNLTQREYEVLKLVVDGQSNSQIAKTLTISEHTAKAHVCNIIQKLVVDDRTQAAVKALKEGLV